MIVYGDVGWLESYTKVLSGVIGIFLYFYWCGGYYGIYIYHSSSNYALFKKFLLYENFFSVRLIFPTWTETESVQFGTFL